MALFLGSRNQDILSLQSVRQLLDTVGTSLVFAAAEDEKTADGRLFSSLAAKFSAEAEAEREFRSSFNCLVAGIAEADLSLLPEKLLTGRQLLFTHFLRRNSTLLLLKSMTSLHVALLQRLLSDYSLFPDGEAWCFLVAGALGRKESTCCSPVGGILVAKNARQAQGRITAHILEAGLKLDHHFLGSGIAAFGSVEEWRDTVASMTARAEDGCADLADLRLVAGDPALAREILTVARTGIKRWRQSGGFCLAARQAGALRLALGFFGGFRVERSGEFRGAIDLDRQALYPLMANIRFLAIGAGLDAAGTIARIQGLVDAHALNVDPAERILAAFHHVLAIRGEAAVSAECTADTHGHVWPEILSAGRQQILKESLEAITGLERLVVQQLAGQR